MEAKIIGQGTAVCGALYFTENCMRSKTKRRKKKQGASVQELLGIRAFTEYGIQTNRGELLLFRVTPTNISVLSSASVETKIRQLMFVLSAVPDIEIACTDSAECFDENKAYLLQRAEKEENEKVRALLKRDAVFLDEIQTEMSTSRQFVFAARCRNMKPQQVFARANQIQKAISEQGFDVRWMDKGDIKRLLALYFDASLYGEQMPDSDGEQFFDTKSAGNG